jgi:inner membrane protein
MPFDSRWFYGDVLFIIDPWLWLVLAAGVWMARRLRAQRVAVTAVVVAAIYVLAMVVAARAARSEMVDRWEQVEGVPPRGLMVGPLFGTPLRRTVIIDAGDHYETGTFTWRPRGVHFDQDVVAKNDGDPRVASARAAANIRAFLVWSRFPFWTIEPGAGGATVSVGDLRFPQGQAIGGRAFSQSTVVPGR